MNLKIRTSALLLPLASVTLAVALSGCTDGCQVGPPITARGVTSGPSSAGDGGYELTIRIVDAHTNQPLTEAGVVVFWGSNTIDDWNAPVVEVTDDSVAVDPGERPSTAGRSTILRLFSDGEAVTAHVPANRIIGVVAAKDGWTEEWVAALASGGSGEADELSIPLYRNRLSFDHNGTWGPGAASSGAVTNSNYAWDPAMIPFGHDNVTNRGHAARIVRLDATIQWNNDATAFGDLALGFGPEQGGPSYFSDDSANAAMGQHQETASLGLEGLLDHGLVGTHILFGGAASNTGYLAPLGLDYSIHIEAEFDAALAGSSSCRSGGSSHSDNSGTGFSIPGLGFAMVAGSALGAAILVRRRL